eukprot:CAMPEP_0116031434 /NCGR_PEP_ID=MMETSP0321-20121206/17507_1 /TAXON_ID=163516 /ORGANISM="Leptocylindrus danicus var. danicus, Strain B650" /LENGTH=1188 /DNA_ID=CAMNT_0003506549 /DNA_START=179 /DNA_END=3745 /DNA_ORIENTATION=+
MTSTAPRIPTFKRRVSYHTNSSTSFKKKIPKVQEKPAKFATIAHLTLQQCIKHYDRELRDLLAPPSTHARAIMGEDGGLELEHGDLSSGDEDDDNNNNLEDTEPLWTRGISNESSHVNNSTLKPAALPFGRRKIALFDIVTPEHRHEARDVIRSILKSDCGNSSALRANIRQALAEHLSLTNNDTVEDVVALGSALLTETLTANKYESMEGLGKCYTGLMDAGRGVLATNNAADNDNDNEPNNTNTASANTNTSSTKAHSMDDTKNILRSIEVLCLTQLTKATGDALHTLGQLYSMCGTARYQRRMVQRIGPLLLRPPYSATYSVQHMRDMEPILVVTEIILRHSHSIFGEGWYARGQAIREDEARMHTIQAAASYLQNLPVSSSNKLSADGKSMSGTPLSGTNNQLNGSSEVQKLDMLIRSTVMGVSRGMCSYAMTYHGSSSSSSNLGHSNHGAALLQSVGSTGGASSTGGGGGGGAYSNKKCPLSPRVKLPVVSTSNANAPANGTTEVHVHGMPSVTPAPVSSIISTTSAGEVSPTQTQTQTQTQTTNANTSTTAQYPAAPLTPKPSIPQYVLHDTNYNTPRSPGSPPKSPYYHNSRPVTPGGSGTGRSHYNSNANANANWLLSTQNRLLLDGMERLRTVMACRALRQQITAYEDRFEQIYRRKVKKPADKAPLASTYAQYREWKRVIRSDAARRIQALGRGYCCRRTLLESDNEAEALKALIKRNNYHAALSLTLRNKLSIPKVPVVMTLPTDVYGAHNVGVEVVVQPGLPQPRSSSHHHHHHGGGVFMNSQQQQQQAGNIHRSQQQMQMQQYSHSQSQQRLLSSQQQQQQGTHLHTQLHPHQQSSMNAAAANNVMMQNHHPTHSNANANANAASHNNNGNNSRVAAYNRRLNTRQQQQQQQPSQRQQQYHHSTAYNAQQHNHNTTTMEQQQHHSYNNNSRHHSGGNNSTAVSSLNHHHHSRQHHSNEASIGSNDSSDDSSSGFSRSRGIKELLRQKRELKAQLKQYDNNFKRQHGRMPVKAEKEPIRHLYETYNTLKAKIAMLEAGGDVGNVNIPSSYEGSPSSLSGHRSPRTLTPPPPLNINTGVGVGVGSGSVGSMSGNTSPNTLSSYGSNVQDMAALRQEKGHLHQMLRTYEKDFYQAHGRQVSSYEDIRPVAQQYRRYKEIKRAINALQEEERSLGRTSL